MQENAFQVRFLGLDMDQLDPGLVEGRDEAEQRSLDVGAVQLQRLAIPAVPVRYHEPAARQLGEP